MPKVPYTPYPTVQPEHRGTPFMNISTPPAAFGVATAQAIEGAGRELEKVGNEQFQSAVQMKKLENETLVSKAKADNMISQGRLAEDFLSKQGLDAGPDALAGYTQALEESRQKIKASLPNAAAQRDFDAESLQVQASHIRIGIGHSSRQVIAARSAAGKAEEDAIIDQGHHFPTDVPSAEHMGRIREIVESDPAFHGMAPATKELEIKKAQSRYVLGVATGLADKQPLLAQQFLAANEQYLHGPDLDRARETIQHRADVSGARNIADQNKDTNKLLKDRLAEAEEEAKKYSDRPEFLDATRQAVQQKYNREKQTKYVDTVQNKNLVEQGLGGFLNPDGSIPKNMDELRSQPGVADAIDNLVASDPKYARLINGQITRMNAAVQKISNEHNFRMLSGMAEVDPSKFLDEDITKYDLSQGQMKSLMSLQRQRRQNADGDPQTARALRVLQPILGSLNITKAADPQQYYHFVGQLQDAVHYKAQEKGGKPLTFDEMNLVGKQLLQEVQTPGLFGWWMNSTRFFEKARDMPAEIKDNVTLKLMEDNPGITPSDEEIVREYARQMYIQTYKKKEVK